MLQITEQLNSTVSRFLRSISDVDCDTLFGLATPNIQIDVPGARYVDITASTEGFEALCEWARTVRRECGRTTFVMRRYFENGSELMASGSIQIERLPRTFESACSVYVRTEAGRIATFQLLLDTYALQKFRGELD